MKESVEGRVEAARRQQIGAIRDMVDLMHAAGRFELAAEVLGGIHPHDFTGVTDDKVREIWLVLRALLDVKGGE